MGRPKYLAATLLVAASGCAQVFGLDETSGAADPERVSLTMQRWSIGASVSKNPLDVTAETAKFLLDDGAGNFTEVPGEQTAIDTFSAAIPDGAPPVLFTLPDLTEHPRLWTTPSRNHRGVFAVYEHPNPQEPLPMSAITLMATLPSAYLATETFRIEAVGAWMFRNLVAAELPAPNMGATTISTTLPYSSFGRQTSSPEARITSEDVVLVERYVGNQLTGVYQAPPFDQVDGPSTIQANVVAVPANKPISAMVTPATYAQRFSAVRPAVGGQFQSWRISAAPGWSLGSATGPQLHAGNVPMTDTMIGPTMYGNPFESLDWQSLFVFQTQATRMHTFMGVAMTLSASMYTVAKATSGFTLDMPAGLPINIRINQVPLSTDGMTVPLDLTKSVVIDAITDKPSATLYVVTLHELAPDMTNMVVVRRPIIDAMTTIEPKVTLPASLFEVDHSYVVDFQAVQGGFADAATGDLQTYALPASVSRADSAVFQVVAP
jgi:hypothetical protein